MCLLTYVSNAPYLALCEFCFWFGFGVDVLELFGLERDESVTDFCDDCEARLLCCDERALLLLSVCLDDLEERECVDSVFEDLRLCCVDTADKPLWSDADVTDLLRKLASSES